MNINHPVVPRLDQGRIEYPHEAGQTDELDPMFAQESCRLGREKSPVAMRDDDGRKSGRPGVGQSRSFGPIADDRDYFGWVGGIFGNGDQRPQVRSTAGKQDSNLQSRHRDPAPIAGVSVLPALPIGVLMAPS